VLDLLAAGAGGAALGARRRHVPIVALVVKETLRRL
jgi:hypothetical protein